MELRIIIPLAIGFVVISGILALILKAVLSSQSNIAIEKLKRLNQENLQREIELKKRLEEAENQYHKRIADASTETAKMKEKMEQEISAIKNKVIALAEEEKKDILADAREEIEDLKKNLLRSINSKSLDLAEQVIDKFFSTLGENRELIATIHSYLVDEALKQMKSIKEETLLFALTESDEVEVSSTLAMTSSQQEIISKLFSGIASKPIRIIEKTPQHKYLAGISIKVGSIVIDATLKNKLHQIISGMKTSIPEKEN